MKIFSVKKTLSACFAVLLLFWGYLIYDGAGQADAPADVAVILGNQVYPDGTLSDRLKARLDRGAELYFADMAKKIVVTGGLGQEGYYEAEKMYDYLRSKGIEPQVLIVDNYGNNTLASAVNSYKIACDEDLQSVIVVSQYFHITRTKMLFKRVGFTDIQSASPLYIEWLDLFSVPREMVAITVYGLGIR